MNWQAVTFDWNQVRAFLATAEEGSLSAAARVLGLTQPTLSRQVTALEENLGLILFERGSRSMTLTAPGAELLDHVRAMGEAATRISLVASGQSQTIEGNVRITATSLVATYYLPPVMEKLRQRAPGITVEIVASNDIRDLAQREADISIRHTRPEQPDLIAKQIGETTAHLFASVDYLERMGSPKTVEDLAGLDFIGFERPDLLIPALRGLGVEVSERNMKLTTASGTVFVALIRQGLGISFLTKDMGDLFPDLCQVMPELDPIPVPIWLVTHRELRTSPRMRLVFDLLAEELADNRRIIPSGRLHR